MSLFSWTSLLCAHFRGFQVASAAVSSTPACVTSPHILNQSRSPENILSLVSFNWLQSTRSKLLKRLTGKMMDGRSFPSGYPIITSAILKALLFTLKRDNQRSAMALPLKYCTLLNILDSSLLPIYVAL